MNDYFLSIFKQRSIQVGPQSEQIYRGGGGRTGKLVDIGLNMDIVSKKKRIDLKV